jgi:predicted RNase H-like nuclease (RuvC/YqgF family)
MSFERIDQYIRELEAIKNYDRVKAERNSLLTRVEELEASLSSERRRVEELLQANKNLKEQVKAKTGEAESLRSELKARDERIGELEREVQRLSSRIEELEGLKALAEGKTLKEAEEAFLKAKENEVREEAGRLFARMRIEWEKGEKPREVFKEAVDMLRLIIEQRGRPAPIPVELVKAGLPEKVEEIIDLEVKKRLDLEFQRRVDEESDRRASIKLKHMVDVEWPAWCKENIEPKIIGNAIKLIAGPWNIRCDKCGTTQQVGFTPQGVESLLRNGYVDVECQNPSCVDWIWRHKIRVSLSSLIKAIMEQYPGRIY